MRVLLADHRTLVREGLAAVLTPIFPNWSFVQAPSLQQMMVRLDAAVPGGMVDLLIAGHGMLGQIGLASVRATRPGLKVVVIGDADGPAGNADIPPPDAWLPVDADARTVQDMLRMVTGAVPVIRTPLAVAPPDMRSANLQAYGIGAPLTARQREVLALLLNGCSTKDIARSLNLGLGTVKVHLNGVYRRLGARNRSEAVAWTRHHGMPAGMMEVGAVS